MGKVGRPPQSVISFWRGVDIPAISGCWEWKKGISQDGYGKVCWNRKTYRAHRVAAYLHGKLSNLNSKDQVLHVCDNRLCCNPGHLMVGDHVLNMHHMVMRSRSAKGIRNGNSKLSANDVGKIRELYAVGDTTYRKLAKEFGVTFKLIGCIVNKEIWL